MAINPDLPKLRAAYGKLHDAIGEIKAILRPGRPPLGHDYIGQPVDFAANALEAGDQQLLRALQDLEKG